MKKISIGEMAKANNISEQTLRLYDKKKLLSPIYIDQQTGYRYYSILQSARLDMIQYMKSYGMNLAQIKELLDQCNTHLIRGFLKEQQVSIDQHIHLLKSSKKAISRTLQNYERYDNLPKDNHIFTEYIPARKIYKYDVGSNIYGCDLAKYEYILRELKKDLLIKDLSTTYYCNVGNLMRKEALLNHEFYSTEIFIFVDDDFLPSENIEIIPAATYLCICCDSFHKETAYVEQLFEFIHAGGYQINGDYLCEVVSEFPIFENNERTMFIKIQIPIQY